MRLAKKLTKFAGNVFATIHRRHRRRSVVCPDLPSPTLRSAAPARVANSTQQDQSTCLIVCSAT